jgi:hypothetical protein
VKQCIALKEDWHFPKIQAVSVSVMKRLLRTIVVCLSIFTLFSAPEVGEAGPFEDFFKALRSSIAHPAQKPQSPRAHRSSRKQSNEAPPSDASDASNPSNSQTSASPTQVPAPPSRNNVRVAKATATKRNRKSDLPYGIPVPGRQGLVTSPFSPDSGYIDVRSFPPGTEVRDPYTGKSFLTP